MTPLTLDTSSMTRVTQLSQWMEGKFEKLYYLYLNGQHHIPPKGMPNAQNPHRIALKATKKIEE